MLLGVKRCLEHQNNLTNGPRAQYEGLEQKLEVLSSLKYSQKVHQNKTSIAIIGNTER